MYPKDTIAAIATAPGRGAIGVVRVSGGATHLIVKALKIRSAPARFASYCPFFDADGSIIDQGIAIRFEAPHSYTGEDCLELQAHGGPYVLQRLLRAVLATGQARVAEPGEFTRRAFLNDKLDLAQAEAVADLIDAASESAARSAARSLSGEFSGAINTLAAQIVHLRMLVEATLDFPEEEIEFLQRADALGQLERIHAQLAAIQTKATQGAVLREGLTVVLAGRPNVGKSSLLNALAGQEVAIVTPVAGTTRDRVVQRIVIEGVPLNIVDTAGLRDTQDPVEAIGIARTRDAIAAADVVLRIMVASEVASEVAAQGADENQPQEDAAIDAMLSQLVPRGVPTLRVWNKADLLCDIERTNEQIRSAPGIYISALTQHNLTLLRTELLRVAGVTGSAEDVFLARARHLHALASAAEHLANAHAVAQQGDRALDLFAEELRLAHNALQSITGNFSADDLLGEIFGRFCIGK
jgi:tRNA modification GTPase